MFGNYATAQNYSLTNTFTTDNGLPSNHIYEIIEDKNGFLWVATDNGISRFDGKRFVNYTTKNGLPSNDVLQIKIEIDGTIWVNCYKQPPSYFDEINNRFVTFEKNKTVTTCSNSLLYPSINPFGGIFFSNIYGSMYFKNKKLEYISKSRYNNLFINKRPYYINIQEDKNKYHYNIYSYQNKYVGTVNSENKNLLMNFKIEGNLLFQFFKNQLNVIKVTSINPFKSEQKILDFKETLKWFSFSKRELAIITNSGKVLVYDSNNLKFINSISTIDEVNYYYKDINNSVWIATLNNGLLRYNVQKIKTINPKDKINTNFLSIKLNKTNSIFAGNFDGEILNVNKNVKTHKYNTQKNTIWIRSIECFGDTIVTVSDFGYSINYGKNNIIFNEVKQNVSLKTSTKLNDSILIIGSSNGLFKLNVFKNKYEFLGFKKERILSIDKINDNNFYFTANSGIFKFDYSVKKYSLCFSNSNLNNDNIQNVIKSKNGAFWFNTFKGNLYLIKDNKILFSIVNSDDIPINITKLLEIKDRLWVASKDGIYVINTSKLPKYKLQRISKSDGLSSNFINDFTYKNDSVYIATNNGISIIPENIENTNFDVIPILISAKVNNKIVPIKNSYSLNHNEKNIVFDLAGVSLTGHFNKFQYQINGSKNWYTIEGNILNLLLKGGENNLEIRAIDQNNYISKNKLKIIIDVDIPLQEQPLFWIIIVILFTGVIFAYFFTKKLDQQKASFQKQIELEQQRNKITADLHDDIGSTLSSLQINSAVANQLLSENPSEAKKILTKIEKQSKNISDKIGDIIWSMKPGKDEFMTMSTRIKNFINEILGSTTIQYTIKIDKKVDNLLHDFSIRKNIILITKEAVNNAAKYSNATTLFVTLKVEKNILCLEIKDNGCGFNCNKTSGNGLGNMKRRTEELKGTFTIVSENNYGTCITVIIPVVT